MCEGNTIIYLATVRKLLPRTPGFFNGATTRIFNEVGQTAAEFLVRAGLAAESMAGLTASADLR